MNTLSWLLYLGEISGSLSSFFGWISAPIFVLTGFCLFMGMYHMMEAEPDSRDYQLAKTVRDVGLKIFMPMFFAFAIISTILPSKETVYLIAASEAGQEVITSPTGKKALEAVNRYLDSVNPDRKDDEVRAN